MQDFDREFQGLVDRYRGDGFDVVVRPTPAQLPDFARSFTVEILGRRGERGVLVAAKRNRSELAADPDLAENVEVTNRQPNWRFDLAILGEDPPNTREIRDARELLPREIDKVFEDSTRMIDQGYVDPAFVIAWGGFEAAMRRRLRASGQQAGWGSNSKTMTRELYSNGLLDEQEFRQVEDLSAVRNQIVHGYLSSLGSDGGPVRFLCNLGHRLVVESQDATRSA